MVMKGIERLVVVVDIRAWLLHPNPSRLASLLQQTVRTFLVSLPPSCRWGFKLVDSSMSPFTSRCKINKLLGSWACSTRFDSVLPGGDNSPTLPEVLSQFCSALNCLHTELHKADGAMGPVAPSSASFIASSLMELLSDCVWNPLLPVHEEAVPESQRECTLAPIQLNANLVIFFSTLPSSKSELAQFLGIKSAASESDLSANFSSTFRKVQGSFTANNVHLCWVDVPVNISAPDYSREIICSDRMYETNLLSFMVSHLGWSFTFLDVLVTGLHMVPFSILWQGLAHPWFHICHKPASNTYKVSIQVRDVSGKLMSANLCKAETICFGNKQIEIFVHVKTLSISCTIPRKVLHCVRQHILAQAILRSKVSQKGKLDKFELMLGDGIDRNFVGDCFFGSLQQVGCSFDPGKPAWQLLMLHLAREERLAIIEVGSTESACFALLEPVTVHLALLSIVSTSCLSKPQGYLPIEDSFQLPEQSLVMLDRVAKSRLETESSQSLSIDISSQDSRVGKPREGMPKTPQKRKPPIPLMSSPRKDANEEDQTVIGSKWKKSKPSCSLNQENNLYHSGKMNLEELYTKSSKRSKTLKVLSCWMRQTKQDQLPVVLTHKAALLAISAGRCSSAISDFGSENPSSEPVSQSKLDNTEGATPQCNIFSEENSQTLNIVSDVVKSQNYTQPNNSGVEDTELSSLPTYPALLEGVFRDKDKGTYDNFLLNDANAYIASLDQKIIDCLSSPEIDLYSFSQRVVLDVRSALVVINSRRSLSEEHVHNSPTLAQPQAEANICNKMMEVLLVNPKRLAMKYKKRKPPESASQVVDFEFDSDNQVYSSEEKVREHELQIFFRMEFISLMHEWSDHSSAAQVLVNEICCLLESIQFNLPGGVLEGESLLDFSNNVIKLRYVERLPSIVDKIYEAMEFNGHDDLSEVEELEQPQTASPPGSEAHESLATEEDHFSNSDNPYSSSSQSKLKDHSRDLSLQRALFNERSRCIRADAADQKLRQAEAKRERAKRFSHFASSCRDLLRVTVTPKVSLAAGTKKHPKHHGESSKSNKSKPHKHNKSSEKEVILQTPFSSAKQQSEKPPLVAKKKLLVWNW